MTFRERIERQPRRPASAEEARALANPLRLRILRLCLDRSFTNEELATRLGKDAGTTLHHVRMLVETGFLAPDGERRGPRGTTERPYRATGKSWTMDVAEADAGTPGGGQRAATLALVDAFRAELAEVPPSDVTTTVRLGIRLRPEELEAFADRLQALVDGLLDAEDPDGEPFGFFVGMHRRRE